MIEWDEAIGIVLCTRCSEPIPVTSETELYEEIQARRRAADPTAFRVCGSCYEALLGWVHTPPAASVVASPFLRTIPT